MKVVKIIISSLFLLVPAGCQNESANESATMAAASSSCGEKRALRDDLRRELDRLQAQQSTCRKGGTRDEQGICRCNDEGQTREDTITERTCREYELALVMGQSGSGTQIYCPKGGTADEAGICRCNDEYQTREDTITQRSCRDYELALLLGFDRVNGASAAVQQGSAAAQQNSAAVQQSSHKPKRDIATVKRELDAAEAALSACVSQSNLTTKFKTACRRVAGARFLESSDYVGGAACECGSSTLSLGVFSTYLDRGDAAGFERQCRESLGANAASIKTEFKAACEGVRGASFLDGTGAGGAGCNCGPDTFLSLSVYETYIERGDRAGFASQCRDAVASSQAAQAQDIKTKFKAACTSVAGATFRLDDGFAGGAMCACPTGDLSLAVYQTYLDRGDARGFTDQCRSNGSTTQQTTKCECAWSTDNHCAVWRNGTIVGSYYYGPLFGQWSCGDGGTYDLCVRDDFQLKSTMKGAACR